MPPPVFKNYTGDWVCHEPPGGPLADFEAGIREWPHPAVCSRVRFLHSPLYLTVHARGRGEGVDGGDEAEEDTYSVLLSDRWQSCKHTPSSVVLKHLAAVDPSSGALLLEHHVPHAGGGGVGLMTERWVVTSRDSASQRLSWYGDAADAAAGGSPDVEATREWRRRCGEEEEAAWDRLEAEAAALLSAAQGQAGAGAGGAVKVKYNTGGMPLLALPAARPAATSRAFKPAGATVHAQVVHAGVDTPHTAQVEHAGGGVVVVPTPVTPPPVAPTPLDLAFCADFTGSWGVDGRPGVSDSLDPVLTMMGLPWLARKAAERLEVVTVIKHTPLRGAQGCVVTEDKTSFGVLATTDIATDGVRTPKTGKDGGVAHLTCSIQAPSEEMLHRDKDALAVLRISTELPGDAGLNDNAWVLLGGPLGEGGRRLRQILKFTKGADSVTVQRLLVNKDWVPGAQQTSKILAARAEVDAVASTTAPAAAERDALPPHHGEGAARPLVSEATQASVAGELRSHHEVRAALPPLAPAPTPDGAQGGDSYDPFFVSLSGAWQKQTGGTGDAQRVKQDKQLAALIKSVGATLYATLVTGHSAGHAAVLAHDPDALRIVGGGQGGAGSSASLPLDGQWRPVLQGSGQALQMRALQVVGGPERRRNWLGVESGALPSLLLHAERGGFGTAELTQAQTDLELAKLGFPSLLDIPGGSCDPGQALLPFYSTADFMSSHYSTAEVVVETVLGGGGRLLVTYAMRPGGREALPMTLTQSVTHVSERGAVLAACVLTLARLAPWSAAEKEERARTASVRALLLQRRAMADRVRRALGLAILDRDRRMAGGEGGLGTSAGFFHEEGGPGEEGAPLLLHEEPSSGSTSAEGSFNTARRSTMDTATGGSGSGTARSSVEGVEEQRGGEADTCAMM